MTYIQLYEIIKQINESLLIIEISIAIIVLTLTIITIDILLKKKTLDKIEIISITEENSKKIPQIIKLYDTEYKLETMQTDKSNYYYFSNDNKRKEIKISKLEFINKYKNILE